MTRPLPRRADRPPPRPPKALSASSADGPDEMGRELAEGPTSVQGTLAEVERLRADLAPFLAAAARIVLVGTGASLAAIRVAVPLWRHHGAGSGAAAGRTVELVVRQSAEIVLGDTDGRRFASSDLVIAISQSGTSPETLAAARAARAAGAAVLAITAQAEALLASAATLVLPVASGIERGASTKSLLATVSGLLGVAEVLPSHAAGAAALADRLRATVASWERVVATGGLLAEARRTWCLGFGSSLGIAEAGALLWHEKVVRQALAVTPSEFRHGPIEAVAAGDAILLVEIDPPDPRRDAYLARLRAELAQLDATLIELGGAGVLERAPARHVRFTIDPGEPAVRALEALVRVQQLARGTALAAGTYRDGFAVLRRVVTAADEVFEIVPGDASQLVVPEAPH